MDLGLLLPLFSISTSIEELLLGQIDPKTDFVLSLIATHPNSGFHGGGERHADSFHHVTFSS